MKQWIQRFLGTDQIESLKEVLASTNRKLTQLETTTNSLRTQIAATNTALGRIVAKVDPSFVIDELDPIRKAESDAIGNKVMAKIIGENSLSNRTRGY